MSAKEIIIEFLNFVFLLILVSFFIIYFIAGDRFAIFSEILKQLVPIGFFGLIFLIKFRKSRKEIKRREEENDTNIIIYLTPKDKFKTDLIIYSIPVIVLLIALFLGDVDKIDMIQSGVVFLMLSAWHSYLFKKQR